MSERPVYPVPPRQKSGKRQGAAVAAQPASAFETGFTRWKRNKNVVFRLFCTDRRPRWVVFEAGLLKNDLGMSFLAATLDGVPKKSRSRGVEAVSATLASRGARVENNRKSARGGCTTPRSSWLSRAWPSCAHSPRCKPMPPLARERVARDAYRARAGQCRRGRSWRWNRSASCRDPRISC